MLLKHFARNLSTARYGSCVILNFEDRSLRAHVSSWEEEDRNNEHKEQNESRIEPSSDRFSNGPQVQSSQLDFFQRTVYQRVNLLCRLSRDQRESITSNLAVQWRHGTIGKDFADGSGEETCGGSHTGLFKYLSTRCDVGKKLRSEQSGTTEPLFPGLLRTVCQRQICRTKLVAIVSGSKILSSDENTPMN